MKDMITLIGDKEIPAIINSIDIGDIEKFQVLQERFPAYSKDFLWLLAYSREDLPKIRDYLFKAYLKHQQILDSGFPRKLALKESYISRLWELVLCDILSRSVDFIPKGEAGSDFMVRNPDGGLIQIEAVAPNDSDNADLRSVRPFLSQDGEIFEHGGKIHDLEMPIVLRVLQAFSDKKTGYKSDIPLIIAINSCKAVGLVSGDEYILRRILFGLGNIVLTKKEDGGFENSFEQLPYYNKPNEPDFLVSYFRRPEYDHVSGVLYTSQNPLGLFPGGYGWGNSGVIFVPNPRATNPVDINLPFFKKMVCNEEGYQVFSEELDYN